jgi:ribosomal protein S25
LGKRPFRKSPGIHQLVTAAFLGPCPEGKQVNHKNGNKRDNRVENLEYLTPDENKAHAKRTGLLLDRNRKVTAQIAADIRRQLQKGVRLYTLAAKFHISYSLASKVKRNVIFPVS